MKNRILKSGIQKRYLRYTAFLLGIALCLSGIGIGAYMRRNVTKVIVDKYGFLNEKSGIEMDNLYQKSDEVTAECIVYEDVQESLRKNELDKVSRTALSKYFAYIDLEYVSEYCYVDNKQNVYRPYYSNITYADFENSGFADMLGGNYAKTIWFWTEDTLFKTGEPSLFIGRYVRSMEYAHEPGMLFLKMEDRFLEQVLMQEQIDEGVIRGIFDENGKLCYVQGEDRAYLPEEQLKKAFAEYPEDEKILDGIVVPSGVVSAYRQEESGMTAFSFVPNHVLNQGNSELLAVLVVIFLTVMAVALILSIYFSQRFTKPIQDITEAMTSFDGKNFEPVTELHTGTELDQIGHSYNEMLINTKNLLEEMKWQEKELRTSELNMLISQINPHFLYNTLDTIYMLARISKEETTMRMIQALSKYLRLSLSKGNDVVTIEDELENVKSYMEIQQIRNANLFQYEVDCQVDAKEIYVLKLLLQPLVENAIKYGFCDIYEGGEIRIGIRLVENELELSVYNSGKPMEKEMCRKLNELNQLSMAQMKESFPNKKKGYGIVNILTRLRLKYGDGVRIFYQTEAKGTRCTIRIPEGGSHVE